MILEAEFFLRAEYLLHLRIQCGFRQQIKNRNKEIVFFYPQKITNQINVLLKKRMFLCFLAKSLWLLRRFCYLAAAMEVMLAPSDSDLA